MNEADDVSERRSRLLGAKLRALVAEHVDAEVDEPREFAPGAAIAHAGAAWVLLDEEPSERLGAALLWSLRAGCGMVNVIADEGTGTLARRAGAFDLPIAVWTTDGRRIVPAEPAPLPTSSEPPARHDEFRGLIVAGGATPVVEHGVLAGEVRGLEVCRVVDDPATGASRLEVGVGAHDREAFQMLHGDVPAVDSLARVVAAVLRYRVPGAPQHPLNRLGAERLIRWRLEQEPDRVGASVLFAAPPPVPRRNLKDPVPCVATGIGLDGAALTVVCSSGIDLDVIPYAADARLATSGEPGTGEQRLVVAMPSRDRVRVVGELADLLRHSVDFASVD